MNAVFVMARNPAPATSVFDLLADDEAAQSDDDPVLSRAEEAAILGNPAHPRWREVRDAFEQRLAALDMEDA